MIVHVEGVLSREEVAEFRAALEGAAWGDGRMTAGAQSALAKRNLQVREDEPAARALSQRLLEVLGRNQAFVSAALPLRVMPALFNRYDAGMGFGSHIDNAIRFAGPQRFRTDVSSTLFLSDPDAYAGGELIVEDAYGEHAIKLPAGDMILYPATSRHRVAEVTAGSRWAAFFWSQSMVKDDGRRALLWDLDQAIQALTAKVGADDPALIQLAGTYHNLIRQWAEV